MSYIKDMPILKLIFIFVLPPVAAFMQVGPNNKHFYINILLTCIGWLPGVIHIVWMVMTDKQP